MPSPGRRSLLVATTMLSLGGGVARARTTGPSPDETIVVKAQHRNETQVVEAGQLGALGTQRALDTPFTVRSYSASLILNQQPQTLGQVLENDPTVRTTFGYGNFSEIFVVRGLPVYGDDVAIDGLYGVTPRQLVSPELVEQVQVLDGANAFLNGAAPGGSSIGGGVNLAMKRAGDTPLTRLTGTYASDSLGGGALDIGRRFGGANRFGARINIAGSSGATTLDHEHRDSLVAGGAFDWRGDHDRAHVSLDIGYQDKGVAFGRTEVFVGSATRTPSVPSNTRNYGEPWSFTRLEDLFGVLHGDYAILPHLVAYADFGARSGSENGSYTSLTLRNNAGSATAGYLGVPRTDDNDSVRGGIRADAETGPIHHRIDMGGSGLWEVGRYAYTYGPGVADNLYNPSYIAQPRTTLVGGNVADPNPINRTQLKSVFGSDTVSVLDNRVSVLVGVRQQEIFVRGYNYGGPTKLAAQGTLASSYDESAASPVVGLVVHPTRNSALYFNRIEGLAQGPTAVGSGITNAGQIFPPYTSVQYEVGGKLQLGRFFTALDLFQIQQPSAFNTSDPRTGAITFVEDGNQRNRGIEWTVSGEVLRGLRLIGGATLNDPVLTDTAGGLTDGNKAIGVPDYTINANLEYDLPFLAGTTVVGRVIRTGTQEVNTSNTLQIPAWTRFDLGARYTFLAQRRPVTVRFGIDNVANERYWASSFGGYLLQGDARTFKLSLSVDL